VSGALIAYAIGVAIAFLFGAIVWHRGLVRLQSVQEHHDRKPVVSQLLTAGVPLLLGALLQLVMHSSGTVMLGMWSERAEVSQYSVAWRTAALIGFVLIAVNTVAQPKFATLHSQGNLSALAATAWRANLLMTICAIPALVLFLAVPSVVMGMFGEDFAGGGLVLQILAIGQFVNAAMGSVGVLLVMSANEREYRNVQIAAAFVALVLNITLIPRYGAVGAAVGAASALVAQKLLFAYFVRRRLGIVMFSSRPYRPSQKNEKAP
jgi:O-antigen/teichoic acid export membrane protein